MTDFQHSGRSANRTVNKNMSARPGKALTGVSSPPRGARRADTGGSATNTISTHPATQNSEVTPGATPQSRNKSFKT